MAREPNKSDFEAIANQPRTERCVCGYLGYYLDAGVFRTKGPDFIPIGPIHTLSDSHIGPTGTGVSLVACPQCGTIKIGTMPI